MAFDPGSAAGAAAVDPGQRPAERGTPPRNVRLPLGSSPRRLSYERRLRLSLAGLCALPVLLAGALAWSLSASRAVAAATMAAGALLMGLGASALFRQMVRPLQTLSNIIVALRGSDFSLRARGARRGDALGDLALEINLLAGMLQQQRTESREALTLAELVIATMPTPVLAFSDASGTLQLLNRAAEQRLQLSRAASLQQSARQLGLQSFLAVADGGLVQAGSADEAGRGLEGKPARWSVRRTAFRLQGVPHTLLLCSDVDAALREEERTAWQRLIRVLGHEINNSLAPISSIAASLRGRLPPPASAIDHDLQRGLGIIEERAGALHRFLVAYGRLSRLPAPHLQPTPLQPLLERIVQLESRLAIEVQGGAAVLLRVDADQIQQMLINLVRNAVDAALDAGHTAARIPEVGISWQLVGAEVIVRIRDNGPGIADQKNLFVPFYTTKPAGSGIGLALAQQIAVAHNGRVTLALRADGERGCDALVRLPL